MSTALHGHGREGQRLHGPRREADSALAARDPRIPALNWVLDDELLSELLGENIRITRTRYKPGTSVLVAFRRGSGDGAETFGWASTTTAEHVVKLQRRAAGSHGTGGIRLVQPDTLGPDAVVAAGRIEQDWPLRTNLRWLRDHGLSRLGAPGAEHFLAPPATVLRYNPERRLVARVPAGPGALIVKTAAQPDEEAAGLRLRQRLASHGVPVLPELADAESARHGISASQVWGTGDLSGTNSGPAAFRAGEALAVLHRIQAGPDADPAEEVGTLVRQLAATRSMLTRLLPDLEAPVSELANRLLAKTCSAGPRWQQSVLVHGDFSADQVLVAGAAVRIIDFDRVRTADPAMDLGSFAAVEEIADSAEAGARAGGPAGGRMTAQLLEGYRHAGGRASQTGMDTWAAFRLFLNSVDPFRNRAGDWPADTTWLIRRALELIA